MRWTIALLLVWLAGQAHADPRVVDETGHPVAKAKITWVGGMADQGVDWPCAPDEVVRADYRPSGTIISDAHGHYAPPHAEPAWPTIGLRAIAPNGSVGFATAAGVITVHPSATLTVKPTCDGPCGDITVGATIETADQGRCTLWLIHRDEVVVRGVPRGKLTLQVHARVDGPDERAVAITQPIDRDVVISNALPPIAGPYTVRGQITLDGKVPPDYDTRISARCGALLDRQGEVTQGRFVITGLPAGSCKLVGKMITAGDQAEVVLDPSRPGAPVLALHPPAPP